MTTVQDIELNRLIIEYRQNRDIVELLIDNAFYSYTNPRAKDIFIPLPPAWVARDIDTIEKSHSLGLITDVTTIITLLNSVSSDAEFISKTNLATYEFILFIIEGNQSLNMTKVPNIIDTSITDSLLGTYKYYKMSYTDDIESRFNPEIIKKTTKYLYHGSRYENWYSIMRSGIKIGSTNKKLFLNGAVYGNGIYLSDDANFSLSYSTQLYSYSSSISQSNISNIVILAVYEVIYDETMKKTTNIYVVPDEEALILRYLIVGTQSTISKHAQRLNTKFIINDGAKFDKEVEKKKEAVMLAKFSRRLTIEYKRFLKIQESEGILLTLPDPENLRYWNIRIIKFVNPTLEKEMRDLNIPFIELECIFTDDYPISAPFPRIIRPRFQIGTGHITQGGSICMEAISRTGWSPATTMEALILQIRMIITDGGAHIDREKWMLPYELEDAKRSFSIAMSAHQWD